MSKVGAYARRREPSKVPRLDARCREHDKLHYFSAAPAAMTVNMSIKYFSKGDKA